MTTLTTELEIIKQSTLKETVKQPVIEAKKAEKNIHSLENFPPEAQKIVRRDMEIVSSLNADLIRKNSELENLLENAESVLNFATTLASGKQPKFDFKPTDKVLLQQLERLKDTLISAPQQQTGDKLLSYVQAVAGTPLVKEDNLTYQKAVEMASQIQKTRAGRVSKLLQIITQFRGQKQPEFSDEEIADSEKMLAFSLKNTITSPGDEANSKSFTLYHEAQAKVQKAVREAFAGSTDIEDISQTLIQAKQDLENAAYNQKLTQAITLIDQKNMLKEQQEIATSLPDIKQLTETALRGELNTVLSSYRQNLQEKILTAAKDIKVTKGLDQSGIYDIPSEAITPKVIWTPKELNELYQQVSNGIQQFNEIVAHLSVLVSIEASALSLLTDDHPLGKSLANMKLSASIRLISPLSNKDYQLLNSVSLSLANSHDIFYHGVPATEARRNVLAIGQLQSRKIQEKTGGKSFFFIDEAARRIGMSRNKTPNQEAEQICLYKNFVGESYAHSPLFGEGFFYVAITGREVFRNYGFFEVDGLHIFDRGNPENGSYYDILNGQEDKVVMSSKALQNLKGSSGQEFMDTVQKKFGDKMIVDDDRTQGISYQDLAAHEVQDIKTARIVPSGIFMDGPLAGRYHSVYQLYYT